MLVILLGLLFDIVAGLVATGVLAALVVMASPPPNGQAWLWLLAVVSIVTVGTTRRYLISGSRDPGAHGWLRGIASRRRRKP